jgi:Stress responsive A/B Barrel Domain
MVRHILLLQPRPETTPKAIEACHEALASLVGRIPGLLDFHWAVNFVAPERREGFTHGFTMDFVDRESLDAYGPHPDHKVAAALVRAAFERIVVLDFAM